MCLLRPTYLFSFSFHFAYKVQHHLSRERKAVKKRSSCRYVVLFISCYHFSRTSLKNRSVAKVKATKNMECPESSTCVYPPHIKLYAVLFSTLLVYFSTWQFISGMFAYMCVSMNERRTALLKLAVILSTLHDLYHTQLIYFHNTNVARYKQTYYNIQSFMLYTLVTLQIYQCI